MGTPTTLFHLPVEPPKIWQKERLPTRAVEPSDGAVVVGELTRFPLLVGGGSGVVAAVGMGIVLQIGADAIPLIGALYGQESLAVGWLAHLFNGAVLGALFVELLTRGPLRRLRQATETTFGLGVGYGAVIGLVSGGFLFPLALALSGVDDFTTPLLPLPGLGSELVFAASLAVGHLVYGAVLGALVGRALETPE